MTSWRCPTPGSRRIWGMRRRFPIAFPDNVRARASVEFGATVHVHIDAGFPCRESHAPRSRETRRVRAHSFRNSGAQDQRRRDHARHVPLESVCPGVCWLICGIHTEGWPGLRRGGLSAGGGKPVNGVRQVWLQRQVCERQHGLPPVHRRGAQRQEGRKRVARAPGRPTDTSTGGEGEQTPRACAAECARKPHRIFNQVLGSSWVASAENTHGF